jgi:NADH-quinone oxidoreductase subunit L
VTTTYAWLVILFPLLGCVSIALLYRVLPGRTAGWLGTLAIALAFVFAVLTLITLLGKSPDHRQLTSSLWNYDFSVGVDAKMQILVDPLSVFMILIVSGVSALIHLYSVTYMWKDQGFRRYFSYLNFFVFSMLLLVLAGNFIILIVGWAFVGAASYLLISFWYRRTPTAPIWWWPGSCFWSGRSPNRPSSRSTRGSPTPWRAPLPSRR